MKYLMIIQNKSTILNIKIIRNIQINSDYKKSRSMSPNQRNIKLTPLKLDIKNNKV